MKIIKVKNNQEAGQVAGEIFIEKIQNNPEIVFGLATGSTPITTYDYLIAKTKELSLDWSKVTTFNLDEYVGLEPTHEQSYRYFMNNQLFSHINIDIAKTHVPNGFVKTNTEANEYDNEIKRYGGLDLQLLGLGINGHVGFNEPGTPFESITSLVSLTESTIEANARFFEKKEDVPTQAISMGLQSIMNAREILLIATGANKAEAVKHLVEGPVSTEWPCTALLNHSNVTIIIDEDAASMLS